MHIELLIYHSEVFKFVGMVQYGMVVASLLVWRDPAQVVVLSLS